MKAFWDERYNSEVYAYGKTPNLYFKEKIDQLKPGRILLPAEGEGRNAVYAASQGWEVFAYDFSEYAYKKAIALAKEKQVEINFQIASLNDLDFSEEYFDVIGLIYVHFPDPIRSSNHKKLVTLLKKGGSVILEAFSTKHPHYQKLNPQVGGPKMPFQLYDTLKLTEDFNGLHFHQLEEKEVLLDEGIYHLGKTQVMRLHAEKKRNELNL